MPYVPQEAKFFPPEMWNSVFESEELSEIPIEQAKAWDVAIRYHEIKSKRSSQKSLQNLRKLSAQAILEKAKEVLGSVVHAMDHRVAPWNEVPSYAESVDLEIEESLENSPVAFLQQGSPDSLMVTEQDVWMSYSVPRRQPIVLSVDTSLSMTGEKLALTAVALAVVLLEFPDDPIGIVAFENVARVLKSPEERLTLDVLIERFLDVPAKGYTHLEDGLKSALGLVSRTRAQAQGQPPSVVLLTDGKYTAGKDPAYLAPRFHHLVVLKMGRERAGAELCRELARKGSGILREIEELEALPTTMYTVVKDLLRGRSLS